MRNSLIQTVLKLTSPGVPDIYNGADLWDLSMVDPDNRRPVDYALRQRQLAHIEAALERDRRASLTHWLNHCSDGRIKLAIITTLLRHRARQTELYEGDYLPLPASGARAEEIGAFARVRGSQRLLVAFARHSRRHEREPFESDTRLPLPDDFAASTWTDVLTGASIAAGPAGLDLRRLFDPLPVVVLFAAQQSG